MPTIFSHAIFASAIGAAFRPNKLPWRFWILTVLCPIIPDADVVGFAFRVSYGSMLGHRGITHSFLFALFAGFVATSLCYTLIAVPKWKLITYFTTITFSHALLDMLTNGGLGVALLAPFSGQRFFFPWRPIEVSPIGVGFFSEEGLHVIGSEIIWIWIPSATIVGIAWIVSRRRREGNDRRAIG